MVPTKTPEESSLLPLLASGGPRHPPDLWLLPPTSASVLTQFSSPRVSLGPLLLL